MDNNSNKKQPWVKVGAVWKSTDKVTGEVKGSYIQLNQSIVLKDGEKDILLHVEDPRDNRFKTDEEKARIPANLLFDVKVNPTQAQRLAAPLKQVTYEKKSSTT